MGDKKKIGIIAVLGVVILGVGAFQFMGGGSAAAPAKSEKKAAAAAEDPNAPKQVKNPQYANLLPQRDPFKQPDLPELKPPMPTPAPTPAPVATNSGGGRRRYRADGGNDYSVPPLPIGGQLPEGTGMPAGPIGGGQGGVAIEQAPGYTVSGMITGHKPMAVIRDPQGNERIVQEGASLDGDTKVVSIQNGKVTISRKGKTTQIPVGGTPNGN